MTTSSDPTSGPRHDQGTPGDDRGPRSDRPEQSTAPHGQGSGGVGGQPVWGGGSEAFPQYPGASPGPYPYGQDSAGHLSTHGSPMGQPYSYGPSQGAYSYNPYPSGTSPPTGPFPAGLDQQLVPVQRPVVLVVALVLLLLSAAPVLLAGVGLLTVPIVTGTGFVPLDGRIVGGIGLFTFVIAALFCLLAVLTFLGRSNARILVTAATCVVTIYLWVFLLPLALLGYTSVVFLGLLDWVALVTGTVLLYRPAASAYYAARRR